MKKEKIRKYTQGFFLVCFIILTSLLLFDKLFVCHAFCPYAPICFGITSMQVEQLLFPLSISFGLLIVISAVVFGRMFCGFVCPLGTIQAFLFKLTKPTKNRINRRIHRIFSKFKYIFLVFTVITAIISVHHLYIRFCPIYAMSHISHLTLYSVLSLLILFFVAIFSERFWCRYICPMAALLNIMQFLGKFLRIPRFHIHRSQETCIDCKLCSKNCPMQIPIDQVDEVTDVNCIHCYRCIEKCPKDNTICEKCK